MVIYKIKKKTLKTHPNHFPSFLTTLFTTLLTSPIPFSTSYYTCYLLPVLIKLISRDINMVAKENIYKHKSQKLLKSKFVHITLL